MVTSIEYKITVNGDDITSQIMPYLKAITLTDYDKDQADELTMELTAKFKRPNYGDEIKVYLGRNREEILRFMGCFFVQSTTIRNNNTLTINATGVDFGGSLKERRNQSYESSLISVLMVIAERNGLQLKSDTDHQGFYEQSNESDMAFLNRLAKAQNMIFNIKNNTLYYMKEKVATPTVALELNDCISSTITHSNTTHYKSCCASYHDTKQNQTITVKTGDETPQLNIQGKYLNQQEAIDAAISSLERANKGQVEGSLTTHGLAIFAGSTLTLSNQEFYISKVTHTITEGWKTSLDFNCS